MGGSSSCVVLADVSLPPSTPQAPIPKDRGSQAQVEVEVSSVSDETEGDEEGLPEPLWRKQLQVEKDLDHLLDW